MINRRTFLGAIPALTVAAEAFAKPREGAVDQVKSAQEPPDLRQLSLEQEAIPTRLGQIGAGSRGKELVRSFLRVPGVTIAATADVLPVRFEELNAVCGYRVASFPDYQHVCGLKDIDAIIVATPLGLHAQHVLAALKAGKNVYGEKALAYTKEEAHQIVATADSGGKVFQVGHQYRYSP